jgi:hypothetical protein
MPGLLWCEQVGHWLIRETASLSTFSILRMMRMHKGLEQRQHSCNSFVRLRMWGVSLARILLMSVVDGITSARDMHKHIYVRYTIHAWIGRCSCPHKGVWSAVVRALWPLATTRDSQLEHVQHSTHDEDK